MFRWKESHLRLTQQALLPKTQGAAFTVHYWGLSENHHSNAPHKHSFFEVCYVLEGTGLYLERGNEYPLEGGTLFLSRPGIVHQIVSEPGMQLLFVAFELLEEASSEAARAALQTLAETGAVCLHDAGSVPSALLWRALLLQADSAEPGGALPDAALAELAGALLLSFAGLFGEADPLAAAQTAGRRSAASAQLLKQAKLYVADNVADESLSLGKVAAHLNISPRHLSRLFGSGIRESFTGYVRLQRIRQAAELLSTTDMSVKGIAEAMGFGSVHYFTRAFRELMDDTPAHYRNQRQGQ